MQVSPLFAVFSLSTVLSVTWAAGALPAPTQLRSASPSSTSGTSIELTWVDESEGESGFEVDVSSDGGVSYRLLATSFANQTRLTISGATQGSTFFFRVRAVADDGDNSPYTEGVSATLSTTVLVGSGDFYGGQVGESLLTVAPATSPANGGATTLTFSAEDLPAGLTVDSATGILSGIPQEVGVFRPLLRVEDGTSEASTFITLRIIAADSVPEAVNELVLLPLSAGEVAFGLPELFRDNDTSEAVRIETTGGDLEVILYPEAAPATVSNFLNYVDAGAYSDVIFHRSVTAGLSIVQAGIFRPGPSLAVDEYISIDLDPAIINEPGISNIRGTIAPAKTSNPNSATSQWFFNTIDNVNLDSPSNSGGFSVFGRASLPTLPVLDSLQGLPTGNYTVPINGVQQTLNDWPTLTPPVGSVPDFDTELLQIRSAFRINPVQAVLNPIASSDLLAGRVESETLVLEGRQGGQQTLSFELTDLDGNEATVSIEVRVLDYAACVEVVDSTTGEFQFQHLKTPEGFSYRVETSRDLEPESWTEFWTTSDGFSDPAVTSQTDLGDTLLLGFEVSLPTVGEPPLFFRVLAERDSD